MNKRLRRLIAVLTLTAAAATGYALTDEPAAPTDTTWGAPDTALDTTWGTPPADVDVEGTANITVTPLDTTWG